MGVGMAEIEAPSVVVSEAQSDETGKKERRRICPLLSLNSPRGEVECIGNACEWFDSFDERCIVHNLKWTAKALEAIGEIIERKHLGPE
jgi:hypothetical protein